MQTIVLATSNINKVKEINEIMKDFDIEFVMPPLAFNPNENGTTFEENALIKAREANLLTQMPTLADDSGLCVDVLNGAPGIHSARYAETAELRIKKLLNEIKDVPYNKRNAHFVCAMVLLDKDGNILFSEEGKCHGKIAFEPKGLNGFGYDPVFIVDGGNFTMAELPEDDKNKISHRAIALTKLQNFLKTHFSQFSK